MSVFKRAKHKAHTVFINRTRKGLKRLDELLVQNHPDIDIRFKDSRDPAFHPSQLRPIVPFAQKPILVQPRRLRGWGIFPISSTLHPYFYALTRFNSDELITVTQLSEELRSYYDLIRDFNAAEWIGSPQNQYWRNYRSWEHVLPWSFITPEYKHQAVLATLRHDSIENGLPLTIQDGWFDTGPVSDRLLTLESTRLTSLLQNVRVHGYKTQSLGKNVGGSILLDDNNDWCVSVMPGQHRAVVAAVAGLDVLPLEVHSIIRRSDAPYWPQVQRGAYTVDEALNVFNRIMNGRLPSAFDPWVEYVRQNAPETE